MIKDGQSHESEIADAAQIASMMAIVASTNIRDATAVSKIDKVIKKYDLFIISSTRDAADKLNFSALRMAGHMFNAISDHASAKLANSKAGNIITGEGFVETAAGKINQETYKTFSAADKDMFVVFKNSLNADDKAFITWLYTNLDEKAKA
jgi:hypothetical protein